MRILKIFKGKPLKRIELKAHSKDSKLRFRLSRTNKINAAYHPLRWLTLNTKYGVRASKTFRGLTLGFQGSSAVFRGRWSSRNGLLNVNLSRSGLSVSTKSKFGTYNWARPNYSSFKIAGIQIRGKKASGPALIFAILSIFLPFFQWAISSLALLASYFVILSIQGLLFCIIFLLPYLMWSLNLVFNTLLTATLFVFNSLLFLIIDAPRLLINMITGIELFKLDDELYGEVKYQRETIKKELEAVGVDQETFKKSTNQIDDNHKVSSSINDQDISIKKKIEELDRDFNSRKSELQERIQKIDIELDALKKNNSQITATDHKQIKEQISYIENTQKKRKEIKSRFVKFLLIILGFFGLSFLLTSFTMLAVILFKLNSFLEMGIYSLLFLIGFWVCFAIIGYFLMKPSINIFQTYRDKLILSRLRRYL